MSNEILARVNSDKTEARLVIKPGFDQDMVTSATLLAIATGAGLHASPSVECAIEDFVATYVPGSEDIEVVISTATLPEQGVDGWIEWCDGYDPACLACADENDKGKVDHYLGQNYIEVVPGDILGVLHNPTDGADGMDVLGGCLKATPGKSSPIKMHSTLDLDAEGKITVNTRGVVSLQNDQLEIVQLLVIPGCVDFSSGHIDFAGSVTIRNAIRTGFRVNVEGDVQVGGLIEAAEVVCLGDLVAKQGMAGKGRGRIEVGGDVVATYLEEVGGVIQGDLKIRNSLIGCDLEIHGDVDSASGVIRGGALNIAGVIKAKTLGAESSPATRIYLGQVPRLQKCLDAAQEQVSAASKALEINKLEYEKIISSSSMGSADKERATELMFEIQELEDSIPESISTIDRAKLSIKQSRKLNVEVASGICSGVELVVGDQLIAFDKTIVGAVSIFWDNEGLVLCKVGSGEARPVEEVAKVSSFQVDLAA